MRFGVVSDLHWTPDTRTARSWHHPFDVDGVLDRLSRALSWFRSEDVSAVFVCGDLSEAGDAHSFDAVLSVLASDWPGTARLVPGNHDVLLSPEGLSAAIDRLADERVALGSTVPELINDLLVAAAIPERTLDPDAWGPTPVVLISHFPVLSREVAFTQHGLRYAGDLEAALAVGRQLRTRWAPTLAICGHLHARDRRGSGHLLQLSVGALVEPPYEATIVDAWIEGHNLKVKRHARSMQRRAAIGIPTLVPAIEELTVRSGDPSEVRLA